MRIRSISYLLALWLIVPAAARAADAVVLATLEWPPYTTTSASDLGISASRVTAAFAAEGITVRYVFLPWNRAIDTARHSGADGYFPEYLRPPSPLWVTSNEIGNGPLYFVERKDRPIPWSSLDDLRDRLIGVISGYVNTPEIDRRLADGRLHGDISLTDAQNLRKLADRRIDLAIIDRNVFDFLVRKLEFREIAPSLRLQARPLEDKGLYINFRNDARGRRFCDALNRGLVKIDAAGWRMGVPAEPARSPP